MYLHIAALLLTSKKMRPENVNVNKCQLWKQIRHWCTSASPECISMNRNPKSEPTQRQTNKTENEAPVEYVDNL